MPRKTREADLAYAKEWYLANIERERAKRVAYYRSHRKEARAYAEANIDRIRAYRRKRNRSLREEKREYNRSYYENHREEMLIRAAKWNRQHPEKVAAKSKAQHARRKGNGGFYTSKEWIALKSKYGKCLGCGLSEPEIIALGRVMAADHVIPIAKGGRSDIGNIQPLCHGKGGCNLRKGARHIDYRRAS
jgi:5-methylcytosine-specific restriction endonuclease McrA